MNIARDIQTLSEFKQNASKMVKQVQETGEPVVLTVNGKPAVVIQDIHTYQQMADADYRESIAIIKQRMKDVEDSDNWPTHGEVFERLRKRYNITKLK